MACSRSSWPRAACSRPHAMEARACCLVGHAAAICPMSPAAPTARALLLLEWFTPQMTTSSRMPPPRRGGADTVTCWTRAASRTRSPPCARPRRPGAARGRVARPGRARISRTAVEELAHGHPSTCARPSWPGDGAAGPAAPPSTIASNVRSHSSWRRGCWDEADVGMLALGAEVWPWRRVGSPAIITATVPLLPRG